MCSRNIIFMYVLKLTILCLNITAVLVIKIYRLTVKMKELGDFMFKTQNWLIYIFNKLLGFEICIRRIIMDTYYLGEDF